MDVTKILTLGSSADAVVLDLGADFVKVLAIQRRSGKVKIVGAAVVKTPLSSIVDGQIMNQALLIPALKTALSKAGVGSASFLPAIVGLRGVSVACARLVLPMMAEEEMANQIVMEAQQHISATLEDWRVDYDIVSPPDDRGLVVVMLVGARNSVLDGYYEVLRSLHLNLEVVDLDVFAMANAVESSRGEMLNGNTLCLDLGRDATRICLISGTSPQVVRSVAVCGQDLTALIATRCALPLDEAEMLKVSALQQGANLSPELRACFENFANDLSVEIKNTIDFYAEASGGGSVAIDRVFLGGGSALVLGLIEKISSALGSQVILLNPFGRMDVTDDALRSIGPDSHRFVVAAGLAQRKKNDKEVEEKRPESVSVSGTVVKSGLTLPAGSRRLVWMVGGGAALIGALAVLGNSFPGSEAPVIVPPAIQRDEVGLPKMTPEQYSKLLVTLEEQEKAAKADGKLFPRQKQLDKLRGMREKGEIK